MNSSASRPTTHSTSIAIRNDTPSDAARCTARRVKPRWSAIHGSPSWVNLSTGARDQPVEVRAQPQVAVRAAETIGTGDGVVGEEHIELRRQPDAPANGVVQPG